MHDDPLKLYIVQAKEEKENNPEIIKQIAYLKATETMVQIKEFEEINGTKENRLKTFIKDPPTLELKKLLNHLEYAFLGEDLKLLVIVASNLKVDKKKKLLKVLNKHKRAIA